MKRLLLVLLFLGAVYFAVCYQTKERIENGTEFRSI